MEAIRRLLDSDDQTAGDPMSEKRWTRQTTESIAGLLRDDLEIAVSASTVRRLLGQLDYSLKSNKKCLSSGNAPGRDDQFTIIGQLREEFTACGDPIISIDTKKKELIGPFKNNGRVWCKEATKVKDHDFRSESKGLAVPYGVYDVNDNSGFVTVGRSADTPEFAVNCLVSWWQQIGQLRYPQSKRLLVLADSGGSNGCRPRAWKYLLQTQLADAFKIEIVVAHYPTGASKWNPVEHRMFSEISKKWAGKPLYSFEDVAYYAAQTTTQTGLTIESGHDTRTYAKGMKISDAQMEELSLTKHDVLEKWNYRFKPRCRKPLAGHLIPCEDKNAEPLNMGRLLVVRM